MFLNISHYDWHEQHGPEHPDDGILLELLILMRLGLMYSEHSALQSGQKA